MTDAELAEARLAALLDAERENTALVAEVERLREENRKHRDVLEWVNNQCPGPCGGVCDAVLRGEHRRGEKA